MPFRQRQYEALVDGQWVDGVADNVVQIGGMITRHWRSQKEISRFYRITYEDCRHMVDAMEDSFHSDVFGVEKEKGKVEGILAAVYQSIFGKDAYPSLEEKAANLLYFMIKDHPYADGCKRIAASLFLEFLDKNNALFQD